MASKEVPAQYVGNVTPAASIKVGIAIPSLGVEIGDSLDYVLEQINKIPITIDNDDQDDHVDANMYCLGGSGNSLCVSAIVNRNIIYGCSYNNVGEISFSWNLNNIRSDLPQGYSIMSSSIVVNGSQSTLPLLSTAILSSSLIINPSEYPAVVDIKLRINSPCGQIELYKTINLFNTSEVGEKVAPMDVKDFTTGTAQDLTVKHYRELINRELCTIKDRVQLLEKPDYESTIQKLIQRIVTLEDKLAAE